MMILRDSLSGDFKELPNDVRIYLCGITVYDVCHIGHARTIIVFDALRRYLLNSGFNVTFVQNFTDVDDKIINRAKQEAVSSAEISSRYLEKYFEDFDRVNVKRADHYPKATEHIQDMVDFISKLIEKGYAYVAQNGVYFSVSKHKGYGKLSKKKLEELMAGARVGVDENKEDPLDFALWKFSGEDPKWSSPWGQGRPGWHIECSAMSNRYLGENFEIHGGGLDLIFPHHENEIAQSEACTGHPLSQIWMHVAMMTIEGEKMSKSLGNIKNLDHVLYLWGPNVTRLFCLSAHYSKTIDYSESALKETITKWKQVENCYFELLLAPASESLEDKPVGISSDISGAVDDFKQSMESDLNTSNALNAFFKLVKDVNRLAASESLTQEISQKTMPALKEMMEILGLQVDMPNESQTQHIDEMVKKRNNLRGAKNFADADKIRNDLFQKGIELVDHKRRTIWIKHEQIGFEQNQ